MPLRIAVVGAESTGTTTLALALAEHFGAPCVPEYGREYALARMRAGATGAWRKPADFVAIARRQAELEDEYAARAGELLVCDTDLHMICLYEERYCGATSPENLELAASRRYDLTILTAPDIPFEADLIRDDGRRAWMTERLRERADVEVSGPHDQRLATAIAAVLTRLP